MECIVLNTPVCREAAESSRVSRLSTYHQFVHTVLLWLLTLSSPAALLADDNESAQTTFGVVLHFSRPYSANVLKAMQEEAAHILRPTDLRLKWWLFDDAVGYPFDYRIVVIRFQGHCEVREGLPEPESEGPLAVTHLSGGVPLQQADLYCNRVWDLVGSEINSLTSIQSEFLLGRALGRVLVHEIYHMLGQTTGHGKNGVTKSVLTPRDLVLGGLRLNPSESELLVNRLAEPIGEPGDQGSPN